jgi:hypothetical protein
MRLLLIGGLLVLASAVVGCASHHSATQSPSEAQQTPMPSQAPSTAVRAAARTPKPVAPTQVVTVTPTPASPSPSPSPSVEASLPGVPTLAPSLAPVTIAPIAAKAPVQTAIPSSAAPSSAPAAVAVLPPDAKPEIFEVQLSATTLRGGDTVSGMVETSSNVASVEARIATYSISVPKVGVGRFALNYVVPNLPFFLHRNYDLLVIARNTRGDEIVRSIPIKVQ